jgi:hypothetical protein
MEEQQYKKTWRARVEEEEEEEEEEEDKKQQGRCRQQQLKFIWCCWKVNL